MSGIKALRKIQFGREATAGTAVDATTVFRGVGVLEDQRVVKYPDEQVGLLVPTTRNYISKYAAGIDLADTEATFEQILHLLEMGIKTVTPVKDGAGTDYISQYDLPTTAALTQKFYTVRGGDNQRVDIMEYTHASKIVLSGKSEEAVMMSGSLVGRQATDGDFTGAITTPTVEEIVFGKGLFYIDAPGDGFGTTSKTSTLLDFKFELDTGLKPRWTPTDLYFSHVNQTQAKAVLTVKMELNSNVETELAFWKAGTARVARLKFEGAAAATAGTTYSKKTLIIDLAGTWEKFSGLEDDDGSDVVTGTFVGGYDGTVTSMGKIIVVHELSAVS